MMKLKSTFLSLLSLAALVTLPTACEDNDGPSAAPSIELDVNTLEFEKEGGSLTVELTATRDWRLEEIASDVDWVSVDPKSGKGTGSATAVKVTVLENTGLDRKATLTFTIGFDKRSLALTQKGTGSVEDQIIYKNDFDKEEATKTFGTGSSWPYLDQFEGWKNASGSGAGSEKYAFSGMSARANSTSNSNYSDYEGSGVNNLFFGANAYFLVQDVALGGNNKIGLSFGTEKYSQDNGSVFTNSEFHIYLSNDAVKWVELKDYTFAGGSTEGRWNVANASFIVPSGTEKLSVCFKVDVASSYRLDDLTISVANGNGTSIDFSKGVEMDFSQSGGGDKPGDVKAPVTATVAEFLAAAVSEDQPYKLTGVIGGSINTTYGNFDLTDETGTVYVYGLTKTNLGYGATNDKSYSTLGLKAGDKVTLIGFRGKYVDKDEVMYAYYVSHTPGEGGGDEPVNPGTGEFDSNVTWTLGANAYDKDSSPNQTASVNGQDLSNLLKLGKSNVGASATLHLKAGTTKLTYYGIAWKGKNVELVTTVNGKEYKQTLADNAGATGNPKYTITVTDSDRYTITFDNALTADTDVEVSTEASKERAILFGIKAE